jgi:hypothetical protein
MSGFLTARLGRCGKPNCHCARKDSTGRGPSRSLIHRVGGKTLTQVLPRGPAVERGKEQMAEDGRFRNLARELIAVSEQSAPPSCGNRKRARLKKLFSELLAVDIVQEIEILLGRQAVEALSLEATQENAALEGGAAVLRRYKAVCG